MFKVFAVRQKSTGLFIPRLENGKRRGGSFLEPSDKREPRLFHNKIAARSFISNWCQGHFVPYYDCYGSQDITIKKQPHRNKEDMEIVEFNLIEQ